MLPYMNHCHFSDLLPIIYYCMLLLYLRKGFYSLVFVYWLRLNKYMYHLCIPHEEKQDKTGANGCKIRRCNYLIFS